MTRGNRVARVIAAGGLLLVAMVAPTWAGSGAKIRVPVGPKPTVQGLSLTLNCEWADGSGYRPMSIDVACTPPSKVDRTVEIQLSAGTMPGRSYLTVNTEIEIPAGSATVSKVLPVPQGARLQYLSLDVWEDGVHLDDLSTEDQPVPVGGFGSWGQGELPSLLFVTTGKLDVSQFSFLLESIYMPTGNTINTTAQVATFAERAPSELVEGWLNYNGLDLILISLTDVQDLAVGRPKVWQAIRQWTCAGGNLIVFGVHDTWAGLASLDQFLDLPSVSAQTSQQHPGWTSAPLKLADKKLKEGNARGWAADEDDVLREVADQQAEKAKSDQPAEDGLAVNQRTSIDEPFVWRRAMMGRVVAMARSQPFTGDAAQFQWVFNTFGPWRWKWRFRHGLSLDIDNPSFDNFLIADIGLPPVRTYLVLITLFAVTIGPVNYWLLRRKGRLHLMLFTVPVAALLASGSLLAYVVVADGLESRLRARSFTQLDQRRHEAVSWARLSYYTGLAPSGGLRFPDDTAVLPMERVQTLETLGGRKRQLTWADEQLLTRGWLSSRTPTQHLTVRAYPTTQELTVTPSDDQQHVRVRNRLGAKIHHLLLCDDQGRLHAGADLAPRGQAALQLLETDVAKKDAARKIFLALNQNVPAPPREMESELSANTGGFFPQIRRARAMYRFNGDFQESGNSLLESELAHIAKQITDQSLQPRTFVAIVDRPADVVVGMDGLIESQSLHVIVGQW
jgi:hypothetical protein